MAIYSRTEFADACGVSLAYVKIYIDRKKIFPDDDGNFDTKNTANNAFLAKRKDNKKTAVKSKPKEKKSQPVEKPEKDPNAHLNDPEYKLGVELKDANLIKKRIDVRIALLKEAQMMGENLPTADVRLMVNELSASFIRSYKDSIEKEFTEIFHRNKINLEEQAKIKNKFITILNETHKRAFDECKKKLSSILTNSKKSVKYEPSSE